MSRFRDDPKRSFFVLGCGLVAFAVVSLGYIVNYPEDHTPRSAALMRGASGADPGFDAYFTHRNHGLIYDAVRANARAASPQVLLEHAWTALEPRTETGRSLGLQGPARILRNGIKAQVPLLKP
jgi:hypothetical protein